ncbi:MAG TPA: glycosyltransferase [Pirellulales bacterium]
MKIGVDMFGTQEENRGRGVGRYTRHLIAQLLSRHPRHEYVLYYHEGLPGRDDPWPAPVAIRDIPRPADSGLRRLATDYLTHENPDDLDVLLLSCAFDCHRTHRPPPRTENGPKVVALLYDLIPTLFQDKYLASESISRSYHLALRIARQYDRLLTISEASRQDGLNVLGLPAERVVNISTGSDGAFFFPDRGEPLPAATAAVLAKYGLRQPFVFCTSGIDQRKNLRGMLQAFQQLPAELRDSHQLLVTCAMSEADGWYWDGVARELGIFDRLILLGVWGTDKYRVSDEVLRTFYQRCAAFVFPSLYEGFGLPILEAMQCAAPVIAGRNSSQPEVVGDAGLLVNAGDPAEMAATLARVLRDPELAASLREQGPLQARQFTWEAVADRAMAAIEETAAGSSAEEEPKRHWTPSSVADEPAGPPATDFSWPAPDIGSEPAGRTHRRQAKPRIAFFSPFSPLRSGVVDYAERLLESLREYYTIDLFHDAGYLPHAALGGPEACHDYRLFSRFHRELNYAGIVYQMCNSDTCGYIYETLQRFPGVVVMHDYAVPEFHHWYAHTRGLPLDSFIAQELALENAELAQECRQSFAAWSHEPGGLCRALLSRGLSLNRRIVDHSACVLVHDQWGAGRLSSALPEMAERIFVVPLGAEAPPDPVESREQIKRRLGFAPDALILGCFGFVNGMKYHAEAISALAAILPEYPSARLLFVGPDYTQGGASAHAAALGVEGQVQFFGHTPKETFLDLMAITDIGVNLRRPPTRGETSAALMTLLGAGVATVITDVDAFSSFPDTIVRKVPPLADGDRALELVIRELAGDPRQRLRLGRAARDYVRAHHDWNKVAALYAQAIEWTRENHDRWSNRIGVKTRALLTPPAAPPAPESPHTMERDTAMKQLLKRMARALWRRGEGLRRRLAVRLQAQLTAVLTPMEARQTEAIADLSRLNEGLLQEVLRLQSQVADLARRDSASEEMLLPLSHGLHNSSQAPKRRSA